MIEEFYNPHVKIRCKYCGSEADVDTSIVLTSMPPQYNVDCPKCGRVYMFCDEVNSQLYG